MPSTNQVERPQEALTVVKRYLRRERPLNVLVIILAVSTFLATYIATSLLPATLVAAVLLILARAPILQSRGTVRLRTDDDPETVIEDFVGPTPPVLAFQWGVADKVAVEENAFVYYTSYLFGLRSADVTVQTQTDTTSNGAHRVELEITVNNRPWATYTATIKNSNGQTIIDVEYTSNRRFGLVRIPQRMVAERYRDEALTVQGYTVVERDSHFGL